MQFFKESLYPAPTHEAIDAVASILGIQHLLSLPLVALSSGQTRRSRIAAGLLAQPRMLILEDPFAGLDVQSRKQIADMLGAVNDGSQGLSGSSAGNDTMRLVLALRGTGAVGMPEYVTHVARVMGGEVETLEKEEYVDRLQTEGEKHHVVPEVSARQERATAQVVPVVDAQNVSIAYGEKKASTDAAASCLCHLTRPIRRFSTTSRGESTRETGGTCKAQTAAARQPSSPSSSGTTRAPSPSRPNA